MSSVFGAGPDPLLERESELAVAASCLDELALGQGRTLVVEGEAGIGKTRLLASIRVEAARRGYLVLTAQGHALERGVPFGVARQLFQRWLRRLDPVQRASALGGPAALAAPALGLGGELPNQSAFAVMYAFYWLSVGLAEGRPLVLVVDDAHWADLPSLRWLHFLAGRLDDAAIVVLLARRTGEPAAGDELVCEILDRDRAMPVRPAPLTGEAVAAIVRRRLGTDADDRFCAECRRATGGNPFLVVELMGAWPAGLPATAEHAVGLGALTSPALRRSVRARLRRLGDQATRLAQAAVVLGRDAHLDLAARLAGLWIDAAERASDQLNEAHLFCADGPLLRPVHPLLGSAVYDAIPAAARSGMHARAARLLSPVEHGLDAVAGHLLATSRRGDAWAAGRLRAAAAQALACGAPEAAARYLRRALSAPVPPAQRTRLRLELGLATLAVDPQAAVGHLGRARRETVNASPRAAATLALAKALAHSDRVGDAVALLERAVRHAPAGEPARKLWVELLTWTAFSSHDKNRAVRHEQLHRLTSGLRARTTTERALWALRGWAGLLRGDPVGTVLAAAERAHGQGISFVDPPGFEASVMIAQTFLYCDRLAQARQLFEGASAEMEARGWHGTHLTFAYALRAQTAFRAGRLVDAEAEAYTAWRLAAHLGPSVPAYWYALGHLIQVLVARGDLAVAAGLTVEHNYANRVDGAVILPIPLVVRGELHLAQGRYREAVVDLRACERWLEARGLHNPAWAPWRTALATALAAGTVAGAVPTSQGAALSTASEVAAEELRRARQFASPWALGRALRASGLVALAAGEDSRAEGLLAESVSVLAGSEARYEHACSLVEWGAARRRCNHRAAARAPLQQGLDLAEQCGAVPLVARARAELIAAGARPRRSRTTGVAALTASELRVARLAATGLSNVEVAQRLFVTRKTVEKHLGAAFAKLGVSRRDSLGQAMETSP